MVNLRKIEIAFLKDHSDTMLYQIHLECLENCLFHVFASFSNGTHRSSSELQIRWSNRDNSEIIFLISQRKHML